MKNLITFLAILTVTIAAAQWKQERIKGNGNVISKTTTTNDYEAIAVSGAYAVTLTEGHEGKITVRAEENLMPYIQIEIQGRELQIRTEKGYHLNPSKGKKIEITVPVTKISNVSLAGSGEIISTSVLKASAFKTALAGSGRIQLHLNTSSVQAQVAGSGAIELLGQSKSLEANVAGSGSINTLDFEVETCTVAVSGSGKIKTNCSEEIKARIAGSGGIEYRGKPKKVSNQVAGSGKIKMI